MPNFSRRVLLALGISAVTLAGSLVPSDVTADPPCPYTAIKQTAVTTGYGSTCTDATNNLSSLVHAAAAADCSFPISGTVINASLVITNGCRAFSETQVQVTGYLSYRCMYCF